MNNDLLEYERELAMLLISLGKKKICGQYYYLDWGVLINLNSKIKASFPLLFLRNLCVKSLIKYLIATHLSLT